MGTFQRGINNILAQAGVGAKLLGDVYRENKEKNFIQTQQIESQKKAEMEQAEKEAQAEQESIAKTESLINDAINMSIGYTASNIRSQKASKDLGLNNPQKNPRGVSKNTYERRTANAQAMQRILSQYVQNKDFRERISKYTAQDLSNALNPQIRSKKKIGSDNNGQ